MLGGGEIQGGELVNPEIKIIDVIVTCGPYSGGKPSYYVVVDRHPDYVYVKNGNQLTAHDSGFYDFLGISPGSTKAFGGREFDIQLSDGSTYKCSGQVWARGSNASEQVVQVGVGAIEKLRKCYVFSGGYLSKTKLDAWLAANTPSRNYYKHDPHWTIEYLDSLYSKESWDKPVCAQRARKLRKKGVTIRRNSTGQRGWSPMYERRKAEIIEMQEVEAEQ